MLTLLAFIAMMRAPFAAQPGQVAIERGRLAGWTLRVETDRFSDRSVCRLTRGNVRYERHALVIQLSRRIDTSQAIYRIDGGPPIAVSADAVELARLGFTLHADDLTNPSLGQVRVPESRLGDARVIAIQPRFGARPISVKVDGLGAALDAAGRDGCAPADFG